MASFQDGIDQLRHEFIPASDYVAKDLPQLERERLWPKVWQVACREEEIPNIGDFVTYEIDNESFLVVRVSEDEIRAFYNVCSHRGRRLKTAYNGNIAGGIMCRFHAWRYDLEGKVTYIPNEEGWEGCDMPDRDSLSLMQPRVDTWGGAVWLTMNPEGRLEVVATPNQDTPMSQGHKIIMGNDVWEHAYYLTYENRRPEYLKAWWSCVDFDAVAARFAAAKA